jgi:hypothetical protein
MKIGARAAPIAFMKLWQAWWIGGALLVACTALLIWLTEQAYDSGQTVLGNACDVARVLLYVAWFLAVWRNSRNVGRPLWTHLARSLAIAGLVASAILY